MATTTIPFSPQDYAAVMVLPNPPANRNELALPMTDLIFMGGIEEVTQRAFNEELAALYLPAFARMYRREMITSSTHASDERIYTHVLRQLGGACPVYQFVRFAREHEGGGLILRDTLALLHRELPPVSDLDVPWTPGSSSYVAGVHLESLASFLFTLLAACPNAESYLILVDPIVVPWLAELMKKLQEVPSSFKYHPNCRQTREKLRFISDAIIDEDLSRFRTLIGLNFESPKVESLRIFTFGCERSEQGGCTKVSTKEELMSGRCRAVRYCSKEHQKEDWKDHRRICFKPSCHSDPDPRL